MLFMQVFAISKYVHPSLQWYYATDFSSSLRSETTGPQHAEWDLNKTSNTFTETFTGLFLMAYRRNKYI